VYNTAAGKITVSQAAGAATKVTSANVTAAAGTIYLANSGTATDERLVISGGIVENTGANGRVIRNDSTGAVTVSAGTVQAIGSGTVYSVYSNSTGTLTMTRPPAVIVGNTYPPFFDPPVPPSLTLVTDSGKITYTWTDATPAADRFDVYWKAGNGLSLAEVKTGTKIDNAASGGSITGLTDGTSYSVVVTAYKETTSQNDSINSAVLTAKPGVSAYIITGSGTSFTATKDGATVGTADQTIQNVINGIRTHASGNASFIQFGDGNTPLDIGSLSASFNNTGGTWGAVELTGKITSSISGTNSGTIVIAGNVSVTSGADIRNNATGNNGRAVHHNSTGTVNISGGTVSAITGYTVNNNSTGAVNISGGTVTATSGSAVYNNAGTVTITGGTISATSGYSVNNASTGTVNISGGTISATTGIAVRNSSTGKITVSGTARLTSANTDAAQGTVYLAAPATDNTNARLEITGGTIENTSTGANGTAIFNNSTGAVTMSNATVSTTATSGKAINNNSTGALTITGGTVRAPVNSTAYSIYNNSTGLVTVDPAATIIGARNTAP